MRTKLGDSFILKAGKNIRAAAITDDNSLFPCYGGNGLRGYTDSFTHEGNYNLIGRQGALCGNVQLVTGQFYATEHAVVVTPLVDCNSKWLYYALTGMNLNQYATGAAQPGLSVENLNKLEIGIPDIKQQERIADTLDRAKEVVEYRERELQKLDELVKARFVEMFGDEYNSMNWPVVNVEDVADVQVGVVIKPAQYYTDETNGIKTFRSLNIGPMYIKDTDWVYFTQEGNEKNAKSILKENDLLIVRSGAPGTACVVSSEYAGCNAVDIIIAHPNMEKVNPYYLCAYTNLPHGKKQIDEGTGGAAQQHFNVGKYNKLQLMLPPLDRQNEFYSFLNQVDKSKVVVQEALDKAQLLFDSLMQEYFG